MNKKVRIQMLDGHVDVYMFERESDVRLFLAKYRKYDSVRSISFYHKNNDDWLPEQTIYLNGVFD